MRLTSAIQAASFTYFGLASNLTRTMIPLDLPNSLVLPSVLSQLQAILSPRKIYCLIMISYFYANSINLDEESLKSL